MTTTETTPTTSPARPAPARRRLPIAIAAAVVLIAAAAGFLLLRQNDKAPSRTVAAPPSATHAQTVTHLGAVPEISAKCKEPTADVLKDAAQIAFAGTVIGIKGDVVVLSATKFYRGAPTDVVEVPQTSGASESLLGATKFEAGEKYLVAAASDGGVLICGYSGVASPELQALYDQAF